MVADNLHELYTTAGVLLVDAQGPWDHLGQDRLRPYTTPFMLLYHRTRRVWKDNAKAIRKHQSQAGAIHNRPQRLLAATRMTSRAKSQP